MSTFTASRRLIYRSWPTHRQSASKKIGEAHRGKFVSEATREKIREAKIGLVVSESTRAKLSEAAKRQWSKKCKS